MLHIQSSIYSPLNLGLPRCNSSLRPLFRDCKIKKKNIKIKMDYFLVLKTRRVEG